MKKWFYGIYGIEFIWHGEWSDPELVWHKKSFNYYDLENCLYDDFKEEKPNGNDDDFATWVKKNAYLSRFYLQLLLDNKCFYGGLKQW
jgi:hypothetical protein